MVDYSDKHTLISALEGVEVVITALAATAFEKQKDVIQAAKAARVKLFVTSEYGVSTDDVTTGIWLVKKVMNDWLEEFGFPYVRILCGIWPDYAFTK